MHVGVGHCRAHPVPLPELGRSAGGVPRTPGPLSRG